MTSQTLYRAAFVLPVTSPPIRDGYMTVRDGVVTGVGPVGSRPKDAGITEVDLGSSLLLPGFVNAHTHLELSHLAGAVPGDRGFVTWIEDQLRVRAERPPTETAAGISQAIASLEAGGTVAVADVSNSLASTGALDASRLQALVLHEILGFDPTRAAAVLEQTAAARALAVASLRDSSAVRIEVAAHAPHSISRELFALLMKSGGVRSIHVAESKSEDEFLARGGGEWRGFLDRRVGPLPFTAPGTSPVRYLDELGVLTPGLLAVHCVRVDEDDARLLAERGAVAVLCPRSNEFLGNGVPPLAMLMSSGMALALGTDSLASCASLDVIEDARLLARRFPRVPAGLLLHALTRGGALALGFDRLGEIAAGAHARLAVVPFEGAVPVDPVAFMLKEAVPARGLVSIP